MIFFLICGKFRSRKYTVIYILVVIKLMKIHYSHGTEEGAAFGNGARSFGPAVGPVSGSLGREAFYLYSGGLITVKLNYFIHNRNSTLGIDGYYGHVILIFLRKTLSRTYKEAGSIVQIHKKAPCILVCHTGFTVAVACSRTRHLMQLIDRPFAVQHELIRILRYTALRKKVLVENQAMSTVKCKQRYVPGGKIKFACYRNIFYTALIPIRRIKTNVIRIVIKVEEHPLRRKHHSIVEVRHNYVIQLCSADIVVPYQRLHIVCCVGPYLIERYTEFFFDKIVALLDVFVKQVRIRFTGHDLNRSVSVHMIAFDKDIEHDVKVSGIDMIKRSRRSLVRHGCGLGGGLRLVVRSGTAGKDRNKQAEEDNNC